MDKFLENSQTRYTTKKYNPEGEIPKGKIEELKEILRLSPSSINSQPWKFIFIHKKELKEKLSEVSYHNTQKILDCDWLVVFQVLKNVKDFETQIQENLLEGSINYYNNRIKPLGEEAIKIWLSRQVYISLGVLLSACADLGIDSTPMEGIQLDKYDEVLPSSKYTTLFAVALGVRDSEDHNQPALNPKQRLDKDKIIEEI